MKKVVALLLCLLSFAVPVSAENLSSVEYVAETAELIAVRPELSVKALQRELASHPEVKKVILRESPYSPESLLSLRDSLPENVEFYAEFTWYDQSFNTDMTSVVLEGSDYTIKEVKTFLSLMNHLEKVDMFAFPISVRNMQRLFEAYPNIDFGWLVTISVRRVRSDATAFSTLHSSRSDRLGESYFTDILAYCPNLLALDLGHNKIKEVGFLRNYPDMRVLILADNQLTNNALKDIVAFCPGLEYLELFNNDITDISCISTLKNLRDLNLTRNRITDITPLLDMPWLERCWLSGKYLTKEQMELLREKLPNTELNFDASHPTDGGWRKHDRYRVIKEMFALDNYTYVPFE